MVWSVSQGKMLQEGPSYNDAPEVVVELISDKEQFLSATPNGCWSSCGFYWAAGQTLVNLCLVLLDWALAMNY